MKGLILGTDLLEYNNSVKILEINTNVTIFNEGADFLDYDSFFNVLIANNIQELHFIYNEEDAAGTINPSVAFEFEQRLITKCTEHNITYFQYKVPQNSITIPYIEDADNKFILRQAFDTTALIDESYCADKFDFFKLMETSEYIPKTYQHTNSELDMDTLDSVVTYPDGQPNAVKKSRRPSYNVNLYPQLSKIDDVSSLADLKNSVNNTEFLVQEFIYDPSNIVNDRWNIIRSIDIIYGGELDVLNLGAYRTSTPVNIDYWGDEYESDGKTLTKKSRFKWVNKAVHVRDINYHADADSLILNAAGENVNLGDLKTGDSLASIDFKNQDGYSPSGLGDNEEFKSLKERWSSTIQQTQDTLVIEPTLLNTISSQEISGLFIKITLEDGSQWNDLPETQFFVELADSQVVQFDKLNAIVVGDKLLMYNKNTQEITSKVITSLDVVYDDVVAYEVNFEPSDLFLVNVNNVDYAIQHNSDCAWCGWFACGQYHCSSTCPQCNAEKV